MVEWGKIALIMQRRQLISAVSGCVIDPRKQNCSKARSSSDRHWQRLTKHDRKSL